MIARQRERAIAVALVALGIGSAWAGFQPVSLADDGGSELHLAGLVLPQWLPLAGLLVSLAGLCLVLYLGTRRGG